MGPVYHPGRCLLDLIRQKTLGQVDHLGRCLLNLIRQKTMGQLDHPGRCLQDLIRQKTMGRVDHPGRCLQDLIIMCTNWIALKVSAWSRGLPAHLQIPTATNHKFRSILSATICSCCTISLPFAIAHQIVPAVHPPPLTLLNSSLSHKICCFGFLSICGCSSLASHCVLCAQTDYTRRELEKMNCSQGLGLEQGAASPPPDPH